MMEDEWWMMSPWGHLLFPRINDQWHFIETNTNAEKWFFKFKSRDTCRSLGWLWGTHCDFVLCSSCRDAASGLWLMWIWWFGVFFWVMFSLINFARIIAGLQRNWYIYYICEYLDVCLPVPMLQRWQPWRFGQELAPPMIMWLENEFLQDYPFLSCSKVISWTF